MRSHLDDIRYYRVMGYRNCLDKRIKNQESTQVFRTSLQTLGFP